MPATPLTWLDEITANATTTGTQNEPDIIQLTNGNILVAWTSTDNTGVGSPALKDIIAQLFNPAGTPIGVEFRLNINYTVDDETNVSLAPLPGGGFIATYADTDTTTDLRVQEYDATGTPVTANTTFIEDNTTGAPFYYNPAVAVSSATSQLIVYEKSDGSVTSIVGQIYNATTDTYGSEFSLMGGLAAQKSNHNPVVAALTNHNYVVIANADGATGGALVMRIVDAAGTNVVAYTPIAGTEVGTDNDREAQVAALTGGGFVVVWTNTDSQDTDIQMAVFNSAGTLVSSDAFVGTTGATDLHNEPTVAALADGGFVIYFDEDTGSGALKEVHYSAAGSQVGSVFTVATAPTSLVSTALSDGRTAVVWLGSDGGGEIKLEITDTRDAPNTTGNVIAGTVNGETITESGGVRSYYAGPGADIVKVTSLINSDLHDGGPGTDTIDWSGDTFDSAGARFDLGAGTATNAAGTFTEVMTNFENLIGTPVADNIIGSAGSNTINGGGGGDVIIGGGGIDNLTGGIGGDTFTYVGGVGSVSGSGDQITDFNRADGDLINLQPVAPTAIGIVQSGAASFVFVNTAGGNMQINVTGDVEGPDVVTGGIGVTLIGDDNSTVLRGTASNDSLFGSGGNDILIGSPGADALFGGAGADTFKYFASADSNASLPDIIADFTTSSDKIDLTAANPTAIAIIDQGGNSIVFANTSGGQIQIGSIGTVQGNDIVANIGVTIQGGSGSTQLNGGNLNDTLFGEAGYDVLVGLGGADVLFGGADADTFRYLSVSDSTSAAPDLIADFQTGIDKINLTGTGVTTIGISGNILFATGPTGSMQIGSVNPIALSDVIINSPPPPAPAPAPLYATTADSHVHGVHVHGMDGSML